MRVDLFFLKNIHYFVTAEYFQSTEFKRVSDVIWQNDNNTSIIRCSTEIEYQRLVVNLSISNIVTR